MSNEVARGPRATGRTAVAGAMTDETKVEPFLVEVAGKIGDWEKKASTMMVRDGAEAAAAGALAGELARFVESVERQRKEFVDPLNAHVKMINSRFKPISERLDASMRILKGRIASFHDEQRRIAEERARFEQERIEAEQRKAEEKARLARMAEEKARQEAEAARLAEQRKKQEEEAALLRAERAKTDAARAKAQAEAAALARDRAKLEAERAEAERLAKLEAAKAVKQEDKAETLESTVPVVEVVAKNYGANTNIRQIWDFEVEDLGGVPVDFLEVNGTRVRRFIADEVSRGRVPKIAGLRLFKKSSVAV